VKDAAFRALRVPFGTELDFLLGDEHGVHPCEGRSVRRGNLKATGVLTVRENDDVLVNLERRVGRTYKAHLAMAKRLQRRDRYWSFALVCLSASSTLSAVALLRDPSVYGDEGSLLWALTGIAILATSLIFANANYRERADHAFRAYRELQHLWVKIHYLNSQVKPSGRRLRRAKLLDTEYQDLLDNIPNHSQPDFFSTVTIYTRPDRGFCQKNPEHILLSRPKAFRARVDQAFSAIGTVTPLALSAISVLAVVPVVILITNG
jgi:hypothetical protein